MIASIKSLTTGVGDLNKSLESVFETLSKINTVASQSLSSASGVVKTVGGKYNLTQAGTRPGTGVDGARFAGGGAPTQNASVMPASLAPFSAMGGYPGYGGYGPSRFPYPGGPAYPGMGGMDEIGAAKLNRGMAALSFGAGIASGAFQMMPNFGATMDRTLGYYQAALRTPGVNRNQLERATFSALGGGISSVGSDAQVANALASMGYSATPGNQNYLQAARQVGGAYRYLGMSNEAAAAAIGGFQTGPMQANLFQYGITTFDVATGKEKTTGQIAKELMNYMTGGRTATVQQVQESYKMGALGANIKTMGFSQDEQTVLYQAMLDLAAGKNPDLQNASPLKGNENTFLTAQGRLNASTTDVMMSAEKRMITGFENAADTIETFNRNLKHAADTLGYVSGYAGGTSSTPAGQGGGKILKNIFGALLMAGGVAVTGMSFGGATPLGIGMAATGASMLGGGTSGFGSSFGVRSRGRTGGSSPAPGASITAGYGATDTTAGSPWSGTNGKHTGIDYAMAEGTPVSSVFDGKVSAVDLNADYGTSIMIDNINGTQSVYAHLSAKDVKVGDQVKQGQRIGKSGMSGNAKQPHLHYELRDAKNHPVNPLSSAASGSPYLTMAYANTVATQSSLTGDSSTATPSASSSSSSASLTIGKGGKGSLSDSELRDVLSRAGFSGSSLETAMAVARAESGGVPGRHSDPSLIKDDSYGLFQINMLGDLGTRRNANYLKTYGKYGYTGPQSLYDPEINARIAYDISKSGTKWSDAWVNTSQKLGIGGATTGYGAAVSSPTTDGGNRTVNVYLKIDKASEEETIRFAKKVKYYLENDSELSKIASA